MVVQDFQGPRLTEIHPPCSGVFLADDEMDEVLGNSEPPSHNRWDAESNRADRLLEEDLVAVVQGSAFGVEGYFRISYATSMDNLKKALERIKSFCESLS